MAADIRFSSSTGQVTTVTVSQQYENVQVVPNIVKIQVAEQVADVSTFARQGNDLIITLVSGQKIVLVDFFDPDTEKHPELEFLNERNDYVDIPLDDTTNAGAAIDAAAAGAAGEAAATGVGGALGSTGLAIGLGAVAVGGIAAVAAGSGGGDDDGGEPGVAPSIGGPITDANANGRPEVSGEAQEGTLVIVTWPDGSSSSGIADSNNQYSLEAPSVQNDGDVVVQFVDPDGEVVDTLNGPYNDTTPPLAPEDVQVGDPDSDGLPNISGKAEPGATIIVTWPDGTTSSTTADENGNFTAESDTFQDSGDVIVGATDENGNVGPNSVTPYTYENNIAPSIDENGIVDDPNTGIPSISGKAPPGSDQIVKWPDGSTTTSTADQNGDWTSQAPRPQPDGDVSAGIWSGGVEGPETTQPYDDTTPPAAPTDLSVGDPDADGLPNISGKSEPGSTIIVTWPDGSTSSTTTDENGNFTAESGTFQDSGDVFVGATDQNGNVGPQSSTPYAYANNIAPSINEDGFVDDPDTGIPSVSGKAPPGSDQIIRWPDGSTTTSTADKNGDWTSEAAKQQPDGDVSAGIVADGVEGPETTKPYDDTTPPPAPTDLSVGDDDGDGLPNISGKGEPDSTIIVTWPDGSTSSTATDQNGDFYVESDTLQESGDVLARAVDQNGNVGPDSSTEYTYANDIAPSINSDGFVDDPNTGIPTISGTSPPGAPIVINWPDGSSTLTKADGNGNWSSPADKPQPDGEVRAGIQANGVEGPTDQLNYVDTTPPAAPDNLQVAEEDNDFLIELKGTAEPGSTVTITWSDGETTTAIVGEDGTFSSEATALQSSGDITVKAMDINGNTGPDASTPYNYPGSISPSFDGNNAIDVDNDGAPEVSGYAPPGADIIITWPDLSTTTTTSDPNTGYWSSESGDVQLSGDVYAQVSANGNVGPQAKLEYNDAQRPFSPSGVADDTDSNGLADVTGTAEPRSTVTVLWPDGSTTTVIADSVTGEFSATAVKSQASGDIQVSATDVNGNQSNVEQLPYVNVTHAPTITGTVDDGDNDGRPTINGTTTPGRLVEVTWPDGSKSTTAADQNGNWSAEAKTPQLSGDVTAADIIDGSSGPTVMAPYSDSQAPNAPAFIVDDRDDDGLPGAYGTAEPGATVEITWPDGSTSTTTADQNGDFAVEADTGQISGSVSGNATDINGNAGPDSNANYTYTPRAPTIDNGANQVFDTDGNGRPEVSGTAPSGGLVIVTWPDGSTTSTIANSNGDWSSEADTVQLEGEVKAAIRLDGSDGPQATADYIDNVGPPGPIVLNIGEDAGLPVANGATEPGASVTVTWPDGSTTIAVADANGNYSSTASTFQESGEINAFATDVNGNPSVPANPVNYKYVPVAPTITGGSIVDSDNDGQPEVSGTAPPGADVRITWPDGSTSTTTTDNNGNWTAESPDVQNNGNVDAAILADGAAGPNASGTYTDNTAPPAPKVIADDKDADGYPELSGTGEPGATLVAKWPDGTTTSTTVGSDGTWSVESSTQQPSGDATVYQTDVNGNQSPDATATYTAVNVVPTISGTVADTDGDGLPEISGTAAAGSTILLNWPDGTTTTAITNGSGNWIGESETVQPNGDVNARVIIDNTGGTPATAPYVDTTAPGDPVIASVDTSDNGAASASGTAEPKSTVTVTWPDGTSTTATTDENGEWTAKSENYQDDGNIVATVTDINGNPADNSDSELYTLDVSEITGSLAGVASDDDADGLPEVTGNAAPGTPIVIYWADGSSSVATTNENGVWTAESSSVQEDNDPIKVAAGTPANPGPAQDVIYTDTTPPGAPTIGLSDDDNNGLVTASGVTEANAIVTVTWPTSQGDVVSSTTADANGNWSLETTALVKDGSQVSAAATDVNGNTGLSAVATYEESAFINPSTILPEPENLQFVSENGAFSSGSTDDRTLSFTGSGATGALVTITIDDVAVGTTVVKGDGNWTYDFTDYSLSNGDYTVSAIQSTASGAAASTSTSITFTETGAGTAIDGPAMIVASDADDNLTTYAINDSGTAVANGVTNNQINNPGGVGLKESSLAADMNGDGIIDYLHAFGNSSGTYIRTYMMNADGSVQDDGGTFGKILGGGNSVGTDSGRLTTLSDVNNDGILDYVWIGIYNKNVSFLGNGDGTFDFLTDAGIASAVVDNFGVSPDLRTFSKDIDNDGYSDFTTIYRGETSSYISSYLRQSESSLGPLNEIEVNNPIGGVSDTYNTFLVDVNNDGNLDVVGTLEGSNSNVTVFTGDGSGNFASTAIVTDIGSSFITGESTTKLSYMVDMNDDGFLDVVTYSDSGSYYWAGDGSGSFSATAEPISSAFGSGLFPFDFQETSAKLVNVAGEGHITGTTFDSDFIKGTDSDNTIISKGGEDLIFAQGGDDKIWVRDTEFRSIDGGSGADTLKLAGDGLILDLTDPAIIGKLESIEKVDLNGSTRFASNSASVDADAVEALSDDDTLIFDGGADDQLTLVGFSENGQTSIGSDDYLIYTATAGSGTAVDVWVEDDLPVTLT